MIFRSLPAEMLGSIVLKLGQPIMRTTLSTEARCALGLAPLNTGPAISLRFPRPGPNLENGRGARNEPRRRLPHVPCGVKASIFYTRFQ